MKRLPLKLKINIDYMIPHWGSVVFEGLTRSNIHYISHFATYPAKNYFGYSNRILTILPTEDKSSQSAQELNEFLMLVQSVYKKRASSVVALTQDITRAHRALFGLERRIFIGCNSHRFDIAVKQYKRNCLVLFGTA